MGKTSICILSLFFYLFIGSAALGQSYSLDARTSLELNLGSSVLLLYSYRCAEELQRA